ncbi:hypothetical protein GQ55_4G367900 [Panicum hallii var. hallii]|uniref:DUF7597 domain-containing protein n=1 Tax=Panicum hallii var. hallii TaxID=1504633 RepID=A0A2T7E400_9POAL|nr:hypothetical protein GQ55_4G367900 [Panicum hallii var. hallii]
MELSSSLDFLLGSSFSQKIVNSFGCSVGYEGPSSMGEFFLLVSFSRNSFRLNATTVGACLHSVLGDKPPSFSASRLEDQIFRFTVSSSKVGFMVLQLGIISERLLKIGFFLCNDRGILVLCMTGWKCDLEETPLHQRAPSVAPSFADVLKNGPAHCPSGASRVPLGHSSVLVDRQRNSFQANLQSPSPRKSIFSRISLDSRLHAQRTSGPLVQVLQEQLEDQFFKGFLILADRCLSPNPSRVLCKNLIKCWGYNLSGHVLKDCRRPGSRRCPREVDRLPSWNGNSCVTGLKPMDSLVCGTDEEEPPVFSNFKDFATSVPGIKENAPSPSSHPRPSTVHKKTPIHLRRSPLQILLVIPRSWRWPIPRNEDLAIVTVSPLPDEHAPFAVVREALLVVRDIQRCPFGRGQAFVRHARVSDRDGLVSHSPHQFQGMSFEFVNHNRGANARRQRDNVLARIIIKARVTDLLDVPHYILFLEGDDFDSISFSVQCEILHQNILGGLPQDEDIPPGATFLGLAEQVEHLEIPNMDAADEVIDPQPNIVEDPPADDEQISYSFQQDLSDEHSSADSVVNASVVNALPDLNAVPGGEVVPADDIPGDEDAPVIVLGMEAPAGLAAIAGLGAHAEPKLVAPPVGQIMGEDLGSMDLGLDCPTWLWAKFFFLVGCPEFSVQIPKDWAPFFLVILLSPDSFDWARKFLRSSVWNALLSCTNTSSYMTFALPASCPENVAVLVEVVEENQTECFEEKTSIPLKRPLVETEVRRSPRIKTRNGGFKISSCSSRGCLACSACPPSLSINMTKAIGEDACKVAAGTFSDTSLLTKNNIGKVVGGGKSIRKASDAKNEAAGSKKKKKKSGLTEVEDVQDDDSNNKKKKN